MPADTTILEFWYQALRSPLGVALRSNRPDALSQRLYAARREACDPALGDISIVRSPTDGAVLWLLKKLPA